MMADQDILNPSDIPHEVVKNRARIRNINDSVQDQRIQIAEHSVMLRVVENRIDALVTNMVSREGLDAAVEGLNQRFDSAVETIDVKITNLHADLTPIKNALYWVAALIIGAVVLGLLSGLVHTSLIKVPPAIGMVRP